MTTNQWVQFTQLRLQLPRRLRYMFLEAGQMISRGLALGGDHGLAISQSRLSLRLIL